MGSILLGAFVGFIVTLVLGVTLGLLLPFAGILIDVLIGGFVFGQHLISPVGYLFD